MGLELLPSRQKQQQPSEQTTNGDGPIWKQEEEPETETEISAAASNMKIYLCTILQGSANDRFSSGHHKGPELVQQGSFNLIPVPATSTTPKRYSMRVRRWRRCIRRAATYLAVKSRNRGRCAAAVNSIQFAGGSLNGAGFWNRARVDHKTGRALSGTTLNGGACCCRIKEYTDAKSVFVVICCATRTMRIRLAGCR
jgi:hypothetical protein